MENRESQFNQEIEARKRLFEKIRILKEKFPDIGIVLNGMRPIEKNRGLQYRRTLGNAIQTEKC